MHVPFEISLRHLKKELLVELAQLYHPRSISFLMPGKSEAGFQQAANAKEFI